MFAADNFHLFSEWIFTKECVFVTFDNDTSRWTLLWNCKIIRMLNKTCSALTWSRNDNDFRVLHGIKIIQPPMIIEYTCATHMNFNMKLRFVIFQWHFISWPSKSSLSINVRSLTLGFVTASTIPMAPIPMHYRALSFRSFFVYHQFNTIHAHFHLHRIIRPLQLHA